MFQYRSARGFASLSHSKNQADKSTPLLVTATFGIHRFFLEDATKVNMSIFSVSVQ